MRPCRPLALALLTALRAAAVTPPGIVYESEAIAQPANAWLRDRWTDDHWTLWTTEEDIQAKRSGGAVLASPKVAADRATPAEGAPPLHCIVDDLPPGLYHAYVSNPGARPLAYSLDGRTWQRHAGGELDLGAVRIGGRFELWVDDRYSHPAGNPGAGYFDYVRFVPLPDSAANVRRIDSPWRDAAWLAERPGRRIIAAGELAHDGWLAEGGALRAAGPPARLVWRFEQPGTFHAALRLSDDANGIEQLRVLLGEREVGTIVADGGRGGRAIFALREPVEVAAGDTLAFECLAAAGPYRVESLLLSPDPIVAPPLRFENQIVRAVDDGTVQICWTTSLPVATGTVELSGGGATVRSAPQEYVGRNHQAWLTGLDPRTAYEAVVVTDGRRSEPFAVSARPARLDASTPGVIPLSVPEPTEHRRTAWPARMGMPFARGQLASLEHLSLEGTDGVPALLQSEVFSRWPDGSVRWAVLDFLADGDAEYRLRIAPSRTATAAAPLLRVTDGPDAWELETDRLAFRLGKSVPALFDRVRANGTTVAAAPLGANVKLELPDGTFCTLGPPAMLEVECNGPVRATVHITGPMVSPAGDSGWTYEARLTLWRGQPQMAVNLTVVNASPQPTFRDLRALALRVPLEAEGGVRGGLEGQPPAPVPDADGWWIHQDFDDHFALRAAADAVEGRRAVGVARAVDDACQATVVLRDFWQTYPSGLAVKPDGVHVRLLPALPAEQYTDAASREQWHILYSWCRDGNYHLRAGQATQHEILARWDRPGGGPDPAVLAGWYNQPLIAQAPPAYLCATSALGRPVFALTPGVWDRYEAAFDEGFAASLADRESRRTYGWIHFGDWFGERVFNYGNSEYDLAWALALQWMRTGDRRLFDRGLETARHNTTVDTMHGPFTERLNGLVWEHSFNHVGSDLAPDDPRLPAAVAGYVEQYGRGFMNGAVDRQGHIFEDGNWLYAALTGDRFLRRTAERVCDNQARLLTPAFDFGIERSGGWPLLNMAGAYRVSGDPYYLNAARLMIERCLERQDPATGGWLHRPPASETDGEEVFGGKAFAVGILTCGILRYLEQEPEPRPDVERMLVRGADWLMTESWCPGRGFRYISNCAKYRDSGGRGMTSMLNAEVVAFAWEQTRDAKYLDFWREMMAGVFDKPPSGNGKAFTQAVRQTIFGLDRIRAAGLNAAPAEQ